MLEIFGKAIIGFIEKELVEAAPELEKAMLAALESLIEMLGEFVGVKMTALAAPEADEAPQEHE